MIENYKGWDITLNWYDENYLVTNIGKKVTYNQKEKWKGVNLKGNKIYGASLKEIRHIIDYPGLHK
mgnify:CR=1 FL=1